MLLEQCTNDFLPKGHNMHSIGGHIIVICTFDCLNRQNILDLLIPHYINNYHIINVVK